MPKRPEITLTAAFCHSAKPGVRMTSDGPEFIRAAYPDHDVRGPELRVAASGEKNWTFRYRDRITGIAALGVPPFVVSKVLAHKDSGGDLPPAGPSIIMRAQEVGS